MSSAAIEPTSGSEPAAAALESTGGASIGSSSSGGGRRPSLLAQLSRRRSKSGGEEGAEAAPGGGEPEPAGILRRLSSSVSRLGRKSSSAPLPTAEEIPPNFVKACKGNVAKAGKMWLASKQWREENDIDNILERPHPHYDVFKQVFPCCVHQRDRHGNVISVEMPGKMDVKHLKANGLTPKDFAMQISLVQEYVWKVLNPNDGGEGKITTIFDVKGLSVGALTSSDTIGIIRAASETLNNHYPERVHRILVVNAPRFFGPAFKVLSTVMPAAIRDQLHICSSLADLEKEIAPENIPKEYDGQSQYPLAQAPEELGLRRIVEVNNAKAAAAAATSS